jgi:hypothetical protein
MSNYQMLNSFKWSWSFLSGFKASAITFLAIVLKGGFDAFTAGNIDLPSTDMTVTTFCISLVAFALGQLNNLRKNHPKSPAWLKDLNLAGFFTALVILSMTISACTITRNLDGKIIGIDVKPEQIDSLLAAAERATQAYIELEAQIEAARDKGDSSLLQQLLKEEIDARRRMNQAEADYQKALQKN